MIAIFLDVINLVAVSALPINCPSNCLAYILRQYNVVPPKSLPLTSVPDNAFVDGKRLELILELNVTVSVLASPKVTLPLNVEVVETVIFPVTVIFSRVNKFVEAL